MTGHCLIERQLSVHKATKQYAIYNRQDWVVARHCDGRGDLLDALLHVWRQDETNDL